MTRQSALITNLQARLPRHGVRERRAVALVGLIPRNDNVGFELGYFNDLVMRS